MTKKIGLPFWKIADNSFGATLAYLEFARQFGEVIPLMPDHTVREDLDLLILPGGPDVETYKYGETPGFYTSKPDIFKEHFDNVYLPQYIAAGISIFGICRGHQAIATFFGGKLIQHMYHETNPRDEPWKYMHAVELTQDVPALDFKAGEVFAVNSRHHQVVDAKTLPEELAIVGTHNGTPDKNKNNLFHKDVEIIAHKELPIVGYQPHPEDSPTEFVYRTVNHLIENNTSILI